MPAARPQKAYGNPLRGRVVACGRCAARHEPAHVGSIAEHIHGTANNVIVITGEYTASQVVQRPNVRAPSRGIVIWLQGAAREPNRRSSFVP